MSIHEAAKAHFKGARGELRHVEVPEWQVPSESGAGTEPAKVYYFARPNLKEFFAVAEHVDLQSGEMDLDAYGTMFAVFARNADKTLLFPEAVRRELLESYDPAIIMRVVHQMGVLEILRALMEDTGDTAKKP